MANKNESLISRGRFAFKHLVSRRQMVQELMAAISPAFFLGSAEGASRPPRQTGAGGAKAKQAEPAGENAFTVLDSHQGKMLDVLAELVIPGSTRTQIASFVDLLLGVDTQEAQRGFIDSLSAFDGESIRRYGHPFLRLSNDQRNEILKVASTTEPSRPAQDTDWLWFHVHIKSEPISTPPNFRDHFDNLKQWIRKAYFSSEIGMKDLGWNGQVYFTGLPVCNHTSDYR